MTTIVAMIMARNEEWILEASIIGARRFCDYIVVFDHASTDRTNEIAQSLADSVIREDSPVWLEMDYRQRMFDDAKRYKPSHVALVDADEIVTHNMVERYRAAVENLDGGQVGICPMVPVWGSLDKQRSGDGSVWSRAWISLAVGFHPDLKWRAREHDGYQHHAREPRGSSGRRELGRKFEGGVMHLQFADKRRLTAKHAWYKMMEALRYPQKPRSMIDTQYSQALNEGGMKLADIPESWWDPEIKSKIQLGLEPWHEAECKRLLSEYGAGAFSGLDLFGVVGGAEDVL